MSSAADLSVLADSVPPLDGNQGWLNSPPLTPGDLHGKVVIYDFWTYSCVNCVRTLPHLKALYARYHAQGLEIVGIHSPEFDFEKDHDNVEHAVGQLGVTWPVVFDDDMNVWRAFGNQYWPAEYLADQQGRVRSAHFGEGDYSLKEDEVRALLAVPADAPRADADAGTTTPTAAQTPEIHLGTDFGGALYSASRPYGNGSATFTIPNPQDQNTFALGGAWTVDGQSATTSDASGALALRYQAGEVNLVLGLAGDQAPVPVVVDLDGAPVPAASRPDGMTVDGAGDTVVTVSGHDLYRLLKSGPSGFHELTVHPQRAGVQAYAYTFGT